MAQSALENGAGRLMSALLGGGQVEQDAQLKRQELYNRVDGGRADLDRKMTQALLERDKRTAQQRQRDLLVANGMDEGTADVVANAGIAGLARLPDMQKYDMTHRAEAAMTADTEHFTPANAILAAMHGQPVPGLKIDGGYAITGQYGDAPTIDPTSATEALIAQREASARKSDRTGANGNGIVKVIGANGQPTYARSTKASREAEAVLEDARAQGEDMTGYDAVDVMHALANGQPFAPLHNAPGTMRFIEGKKAPISVPIKPGTQGALPAPDGPGLVQRALAALGFGGDEPPAAPAARPPTARQAAPVAAAHPLVNAPKAAPPPAAVAFLRANPGQAAAFEAKYGVPAAMFLH